MNVAAREKFAEYIGAEAFAPNGWPAGACDCKDCARGVFDLVVEWLRDGGYVISR
jgi:hypothetical protein